MCEREIFTAKMDESEKEMLLSVAEELHEDMDADALGLADDNPMHQLFLCSALKEEDIELCQRAFSCSSHPPASSEAWVFQNSGLWPQEEVP